MMTIATVRKCFALVAAADTTKAPLVAIKLAHIAQEAGSPSAALALALQCRALKATAAGNKAEAARLSELVGRELKALGCY